MRFHTDNKVLSIPAFSFFLERLDAFKYIYHVFPHIRRQLAMKTKSGAVMSVAVSVIFLSAALAACGGGESVGDSGTDASADAGGGGVLVSEDGGILTARTTAIELAIDREKGTFDIRDLVWKTEINRVHMAVELPAESGPRAYTTIGKKFPCTVDGAGAKAVITCTGDTASGFSVKAVLSLNAAKPGVLGYESEFENKSSNPVTIRKIYPFRSSTSNGGSFFIGNDPSRVRILQNGTDEVVDFFPNMLPGDTALTDPEGNALLQGKSSYSSGNSIAFDLETGASLLAGFTDFEWAIPLVAMAGDKTRSKTAGNRNSMTDLWGEARYPWNVAIPAGKKLSGGTAVIVAGAATPHDALESYADEVALRKSIKLPAAPMSGWDSWYTHGPDTEQYMRDNADSLAALFGPFGLSSMQLDSGWQDTWGDWNAASSFPSGMKSTSDYIKNLGLKPEIWMAPLSVKSDSAFYKVHPDWYMPKNDYGKVLVSKDNNPFDLSNPGVIERIKELGGRLKDWGYQSVKMDFAYYTLVTVIPADPDKTNVSLYRAAVKAFHEALGPEPYFINIAMCYPNYGLVDAFRIGLDTWPCWSATKSDCSDEGARGISAVGIKPATINAARRYWMNGRIWWNHNDQIFFRTLTQDEIKSWVTMALVSGGMISLGDNTVGMTPEQGEPYRKILPLTGLTARPVDLFKREVPEVWHLKTAEPGEADVVALFNWGDNLDFSVNPYVERKDGAPVTHVIDFATLGMDPSSEYVAWEFWTGKFQELKDGNLTSEVPPHSTRIYRMIKKTSVPSYLATDRHVTMGPAIVKSAVYDMATGKLTGQVRTAPGYAQKLYFWIPSGYSATSPKVEGASDAKGASAGESVYAVSFTGADSAFHGFELTITPPP
jgi:hypothetical protein